MQPSELDTALRPWCAAHPGVLACEATPEGVRLVEIATGKALQLDAATVTGIETRVNPQTGADYLVLERDGVPPLAVADAGLVFALDTRNSGPLDGAPPVLCFRDYRRFAAHLEHLAASPDERRAGLDLLRLCIAALDGARAAGLEVAVEEIELERLLRRFEAGA